jgi:divalent metal cation (Fe/Co/Zn/Cd) transporter
LARTAKKYNSQALEADAVAALGVSVLVIWVCWPLGRRTIDALVDSSPAGREQPILAAVSAVPGARDCHNIRVRYSGPSCSSTCTCWWTAGRLCSGCTRSPKPSKA